MADLRIAADGLPLRQQNDRLPVRRHLHRAAGHRLRDHFAGLGEFQRRACQTRAHPVRPRRELIDFRAEPPPRRLRKPMLLHAGQKPQHDLRNSVPPSDMPVAAARDFCRLAENQAIPRSQRPPVKSSETRPQVRRRAAQQVRHPQSAGHREAGADAAR